MPLRRVAGWLERANAHPVVRWLVIVGIALPLVLSVVVSAQYFSLTSRVNEQQKHRDAFVQCVAAWADQSTQRTERLTAANQKLQAAKDAQVDAIGALLASIPSAPTTDPVRLAAVRKRFYDALAAEHRAGAAADEAQRTYAKALRQNPIPDAPKFQCK